MVERRITVEPGEDLADAIEQGLNRGLPCPNKMFHVVEIMAGQVHVYSKRGTEYLPLPPGARVYRYHAMRGTYPFSPLTFTLEYE